jgi:hypothetical protein
LEAKISLSGEYYQNSAGSIKLPGVLTGEGRIGLGALSVLYQNKAQRGIKKSPDIKNGFTLPADIPDNNLIQQRTPSAFTSLTEEVLLLGNIENTDIPAMAEIFISETELQKNTIWDELAILFSSIPLLEEEILIEGITEEQNALAEAAEGSKPDILPEVQQYKADQLNSGNADGIPVSDFPAEGNSAGMNNEETEKAGRNKGMLSMAKAYTADSFQERKNLAALPENF